MRKLDCSHNCPSFYISSRYVYSKNFTYIHPCPVELCTYSVSNNFILLFMTVLEDARKMLDCAKNRININGVNMSHLRFAYARVQGQEHVKLDP